MPDYTTLRLSGLERPFYSALTGCFFAFFFFLVGSDQGPGAIDCRVGVWPSEGALAEEMPGIHVPKPAWGALRPYYIT